MESIFADIADPAGTLDAKRFSTLVRRRRTVSLALSSVMLTIYYGFLVILAFRAELFAIPIGAQMTLGIPVGIGVILAAWLLTGIYVVWANTRHDRAVDTLKTTLEDRP